tara:strand:+ start:104 stop:1297 length:1194 start_codon:yes stop_codon:yes gene_type:complete
MAYLEAKHLQSASKAYIGTTELFFDKVFGKDKKKVSHDFSTKDGVFTATGLEVVYKDKKTKEYKSLKERSSYLKNSPNVEEAFLIGKYKGSKQKTKVRHNKVTKTAEFGGKAVGTKTESKGTIFEREFTNRLKDCINGNPCVGKYHEAAGWLVGQLENGGKNPIKDFQNVGGGNLSRPFEVAGSQPYIAPSKHQDHAKVLTDINVLYKNGGPPTYLSAKFGGSKTFINPGSKTLFSDQDIKDHNINTIKGKALLEMCGLDEDAFCNVFNNFGKNAQKTKNKNKSGVVKIDKKRLESFVKTCIGSNYWMIWGKETGGGGVDMYWMKPSDVENKYSKVSSDVEVFYGGKEYAGKRIDIEFHNQYFKFTLNIRSKAGGKNYPTNVMLDYKDKAIIGKTTL